MAVTVTEETDPFGDPIIHIKDEAKLAATFSIMKSHDGYAFYEIKISKGQVAEALKGKFTKSTDAQRKVVKYLEGQPVGNTVRRKQMKERMEKDAK